MEQLSFVISNALPPPPLEINVTLKENSVNLSFVAVNGWNIGHTQTTLPPSAALFCASASIFLQLYLYPAVQISSRCSLVVLLPCGHVASNIHWSAWFAILSLHLLTTVSKPSPLQLRVVSNYTVYVASRPTWFTRAIILTRKSCSILILRTTDALRQLSCYLILVFFHFVCFYPVFVLVADV